MMMEQMMTDYIEIPVRIKLSKTTQLILKEIDAIDEHLKIDLAQDFYELLERRYRFVEDVKSMDMVVRKRAMEILDQLHENDEADEAKWKELKC